MRHLIKLMVLVAGLLAMPATMQALPFVTTNDPESEDTHWYCIKTENQYLYYDEYGYIQLNTSSSGSNADEYLWCFVSGDLEGYRIYNRKARYYMTNGYYVNGSYNERDVNKVEWTSGNSFYIYFLQPNGQKYYLNYDSDNGFLAHPGKWSSYTAIEYVFPVTADPVINTETTDEKCVISATGKGEVILYVNDKSVSNPYTIDRTYKDQTITITATAQEAGKKKGRATLEFTVPRLNPDKVSLTPYAYHSPNNEQDPEGDEGYRKMFDNDPYSKWCVVNNSGAWETIWVDFKTETPIIPITYGLIPGFDSWQFTTRNPKVWRVYGKMSEDDDWVTLAQVTDSANILTTKWTLQSFSFYDTDDLYQYFRFEVSEIVGKDKWGDNDYTFQMSEFDMWGYPSDLDALIPYYCYAPNNKQDINGDEGYRKLFDNDDNTKWCAVNSTDTWQTIWADFISPTPIKPIAYSLTAAADTRIYPDRNPKAWRLRAKAKKTDPWVTLDEVTDGAAEGMKLEGTTEFYIDKPSTPYQYFRFEVREVGSDDSYSHSPTFQLAELRLMRYLLENQNLIPQSCYTPNNMQDINGDEGYRKLFDKDENTKWCVINGTNEWETISVDFKTQKRVIPFSYILTAAADAKTYPERNPKAWKLYGKASENDPWVVLDEVTSSDAGMELTGSTEFKLNTTDSYLYFRFEVSEIGGNEKINSRPTFQLAEFGMKAQKPSGVSGDITGDEKVDVEDVNAAINIILETKTEADFAGSADLNDDGKVDVEDVNAIINIILEVN